MILVINVSILITADYDVEKVQTAYDITLFAQCSLPPPYAQGNLKGTKQTTEAECGIQLDEKLKYLVYVPALLDPLEPEGKTMLQAIAVNTKNMDHIMFLALCCPQVLLGS